MREIKFRLVKDGKIVGFEEHRGGDIFHKIKGKEGWFSITHFQNKVDYHSKDQYTGLNDKEGNEIYEKDIILSLEDPFLITFSSTQYVLMHLYINEYGYILTIGLASCYTPQDHLIIGNYHENLEDFDVSNEYKEKILEEIK